MAIERLKTEPIKLPGLTGEAIQLKCGLAYYVLMWFKVPVKGGVKILIFNTKDDGEVTTWKDLNKRNINDVDAAIAYLERLLSDGKG